MSEWMRVIFPHDLDERGHCPVCDVLFKECDCPAEDEQGVAYEMVNGILWGRRIDL